MAVGGTRQAASCANNPCDAWDLPMGLEGRGRPRAAPSAISNTPLQIARLGSSWKESWGVVAVKVNRTYSDVMTGVMMLREVVSKVLKSWMPYDQHVFGSDLIAYPKIPYLERTRALLLHGAVGNAHGGAVIAMDQGRRLGMSELLQGKADDHCLLDV